MQFLGLSNPSSCPFWIASFPLKSKKKPTQFFYLYMHIVILILHTSIISFGQLSSFIENKNKCKDALDCLTSFSHWKIMNISKENSCKMNSISRNVIKFYKTWFVKDFSNFINVNFLLTLIKDEINCCAFFKNRCLTLFSNVIRDCARFTVHAQLRKSISLFPCT